MASLLLPLNNPELFLFQAQKVKSNDIKQMLDSVKFFTLGRQVLMVHIESEIRHLIDYPATSKQTENCLVDPELLHMDG